VAKFSLARGKENKEELTLKSLLPESFARLAQHYLIVGERQKALDLLSCYSDRYSEYPVGNWMLGKLYYEIGEKEKALGFIHKVLQVVPEHPAALELMARIYEEAGQDALANSYRLQLGQLDPVGRIIFEAEPDKSLVESREILEAGAEEIDRKTSSFATETMVRLYLAQGDRQMASDLCSEILVRLPDNDRIRSILKDLEN